MGVIQWDSCIHHSAENSHRRSHVQLHKFCISIDSEYLFLGFLWTGKTSVCGQLSPLIFYLTFGDCHAHIFAFMLSSTLCLKALDQIDRHIVRSIYSTIP